MSKQKDAMVKWMKSIMEVCKSNGNRINNIAAGCIDLCAEIEKLNIRLKKLENVNEDEERDEDKDEDEDEDEDKDENFVL